VESPGSASGVPDERLAAVRPRRLLLIGNPNTGKTTLFNRLCGLRAKTANFPGTTTDVRRGRMLLPAPTPVDSPEVAELVDLPGTYGLELGLPEAHVARTALRGVPVAFSGGGSLGREPVAGAIVVADATNLAPSLRLVAELGREGVPLVVVLNMIDLARRRGLSFDVAKLSAHLGAPVVMVAARGGEGIDALRRIVRARIDQSSPSAAGEPSPQVGKEDDLDVWADSVIADSVGGARAVGAAGDGLLDRLDVTFTHPFLGLVVFLAVMAGLFWAIFALATVPMDLIEATFAHLGGWLEASLPAGAVRDLLVGGLLGGISGTIVFLPQICLLFFLITLLEDTGYLARAAFVMDRLLCRFGLPGHAFVPLLSSHACAIPGILAARLIPDRWDRVTTILVAPFMSCSARLPVYVLLTTFLFRDRPLLAGLAFAGCYLLGALAALFSALLARRTVLRGASRPMILELPSYKRPSLRVALATAFDQGWSFLRTVGTVILAICLVMWWLSAYPKAGPSAAAAELEARAAALVTDAPDQAEALMREARQVAAQEQQGQSFAARLGRVAEPLFAPLGYDWRLSMGVVTSFAAREVFVATLAVVVGAPVDSEAGVLERIHAARRDDGTPLLTVATAVSLVIFFVLAMQCLSTVVTVRRETRGWRWPLAQFAWMSGLAWLGAFVAYQGLRAAGIS
jgi:ferrous iron transport protein B